MLARRRSPCRVLGTLLGLLLLVAAGSGCATPAAASAGAAGPPDTVRRAVAERLVAVPLPPTHAERLALKTRRPHLLPPRSGQGRRVVYDRSAQRVWLVGRHETVHRTYLVSGQTGQPRPGAYRVYSRSRHARSAVSAETMRLMVRFAYGRRTAAPIGFHTIPRHPDGRPAQTVAQLGEPLSAGCVRQRTADARALWAFAPVGTRVVVLP